MPPLTVLSLATIMHVTPSTTPTPVMRPPAGTSASGYSSWPASGESSIKVVPGSIKAVTRSLGSIFLRARCFSLAFAGPPSWAVRVSSSSRAMASPIKRSFSLNSSEAMSISVWRTEMALAW